jgi:uncharacterized protein YebE (UPF0316 family)
MKKKNTVKLFGIIALVAVIGFAMAACGDPGEEKATVDSVTVQAEGVYGSATIGKGQTLQFYAGVDGNNSPAQTVTWSIAETGKHAQTTINNNGLLTVSTAETLASLTVKAASTVDTGKSGTMAVGIVPVWTAVTDTKFGTTDDDFISAIAYGNGKFIAGGTKGKMAYSSNGIIWTAVTNSQFSTHVNSEIRAIAYGNGKFVAAGYNEAPERTGGYAVYSSDGITWTAATNHPAGYFYGIAYGNDRFVAVGSYGTIAYSFDGITWTAVTNSIFETWDHLRAIAYGNGKFVAVGGDYDYGTIAYSSDGITWTAVTNNPFYEEINQIVYGNNKFIAEVSFGNMAYSADGVTWTALPYVEDDYYTYKIAYGNNKFVGVVGGFSLLAAYSSDGITWLTVPGSTLAYSIPISDCLVRAIAYGNDKFVAVGYDGKMVYSSGD